MPVDEVKNSCNCEWCSIRRDLGSARPEHRGWHWARLWRHYLETALEAHAETEKGNSIHQMTIDETTEIAEEGNADFEKEWRDATGRGQSE